MLDKVTLFVIVDNDAGRQVHAVCESAEQAEKIRQEILHTAEKAKVSGLYEAGLSIHAMHAMFPGDRYRLVFGTPESPPEHPLCVPSFCDCTVTNSDAHSEAYLYPDELYLNRSEAMVAAARHNMKQLKRGGQSLDWAVVAEIGEPLWRRYRSECLVRKGVGWEDTDLLRPVRVIQPTKEEVAGGSSASKEFFGKGEKD